MPRLRPFRHLAATLLGATMLVTAATGTAAQDATPTPTADRGIAYPVSIHRGTCEAPVAQPVGPTLDTEVAGYSADSTIVGAPAQSPVLTASADIDGTLDDFTEVPHVVAVHASAEAYGEIVACGEIAGYNDDGTIVFGLRSVDDSRVSGIAVLEDAPTALDRALEAVDLSDLLDDGTLHLTVYIIPADSDPTGA